jgi:RNA polymerase sigma factor (sigma-70 family)
MMTRAPMSDRDECALWARARAGAPEAFGALFDLHAPAICRYCFHRLGDWEEAEDLTSVVFLEAYRLRDAAVPAESLRAWLFGIAKNVVRNRQRSLRRHRRALARLPRDAFADDISETAVARADAALVWQPLLARVRRLPLVEQEVLALCAWGDLSYEEAAHALSIPVGTVRSRLARARSRLRGETAAAAALAQEVTSCE